MQIERLKKRIESSHINFLFGSGLSRPYLPTLGKIENWLTDAEDVHDENVKKIISASIYIEYFNKVMLPCLPDKFAGSSDYLDVIAEYSRFLKLWNEIIARREGKLQTKQINVFSTNIDDFVEKTAEKNGIEFNDGFRGHLNPILKEDSFTNVVSRISPLYQNSAVVPVFNFMKLHGSINWVAGKENDILLDQSLILIQEIEKTIGTIDKAQIFSGFDEKTEFKNLKEFAENITRAHGFSLCPSIDMFIEKYNELVMVNPRKAKFRETVLDLHFYELLRLYSNALESSSSLLFVMGFSFADEHLAKITIRAANSNPTLLVLVLAHSNKAKDEITNNIKKGGTIINNNVIIASPESFIEAQQKDIKDSMIGLSKFDFKSINTFVFEKINKLVCY